MVVFTQIMDLMLLQIPVEEVVVEVNKCLLQIQEQMVAQVVQA